MATKKIAVVTGANQGIGFAVAKHLAALPDIHVILTSRDVAKGQQAVAELASLGRTVELEQLDVADEASITAFAKRVLEKHGRVDILVNNAGIASPRGWNTSFLDAKVEDINTVFQTNTIGPLRLCQLFVPVMVKNNYGRIVNMSSGAGQISDMNGKNVDYRFSKISLNALTKIINDEMKDKNVIVNSMCPGIVRTAMTKGATIPADRIKEPDVPAETAVWLATLPDSGPRGGFFRNKQPIAW